MSSSTPTRHWTEDGPTEGYVYLAIRDNTDFSIKIGSTRTTPAQRLAQTPSCTQDAFIIACVTTAARELEYHLQVYFTQAGKSLGDREHFNLTVQDVLHVALWFDGSTFTPQEGTEPHTMYLVDEHGQSPTTLRETAVLLAEAAINTIYALDVRGRREERARLRRRSELFQDWEVRSADRWKIEPDTFSKLLRTGKIEEELSWAREYIDQGQPAPTARKPLRLKEYLEELSTIWPSVEETPDWLH